MSVSCGLVVQRHAPYFPAPPSTVRTPSLGLQSHLCYTQVLQDSATAPAPSARRWRKTAVIMSRSELRTPQTGAEDRQQKWKWTMWRITTTTWPPAPSFFLAIVVSVGRAGGHWSSAALGLFSSFFIGSHFHPSGSSAEATQGPAHGCLRDATNPVSCKLVGNGPSPQNMPKLKLEGTMLLFTWNCGKHISVVVST